MSAAFVVLLIEEDVDMEPKRKKPGRRKLIIVEDFDLNLECLDVGVVWVESMGLMEIVKR